MCHGGTSTWTPSYLKTYTRPAPVNGNRHRPLAVCWTGTFCAMIWACHGRFWARVPDDHTCSGVWSSHRKKGRHNDNQIPLSRRPIFGQLAAPPPKALPSKIGPSALMRKRWRINSACPGDPKRWVPTLPPPRGGGCLTPPRVKVQRNRGRAQSRSQFRPGRAADENGFGQVRGVPLVSESLSRAKAPGFRGRARLWPFATGQQTGVYRRPDRGTFVLTFPRDSSRPEGLGGPFDPRWKK